MSTVTAAETGLRPLVADDDRTIRDEGKTPSPTFAEAESATTTGEGFVPEPGLVDRLLSRRLDDLLREPRPLPEQAVGRGRERALARRLVQRISGRLTPLRNALGDAGVANRIGDLVERLDETIDRSRALLRDLDPRRRDAEPDLDALRAELRDGIEALRSALAGAEPATAVRRIETGAERERTFELEVVTADGDVVRLRFESEESASRTRISGDGVDALQTTYASRLAGSFTVEGDLDEEERAAIEALVGETREIAERFWAGEVDGAFRDAAALTAGSDDGEIRAFELELRQSVAIYAAASGTTGGGGADPLEAVGDAIAERERTGPLANRFPDLQALVRELLAGFLANIDGAEDDVADVPFVDAPTGRPSAFDDGSTTRA